MRRSLFAAWLLLVCGVASAQWGDLTAQFMLDGTPAKATKLDVSKEAFCVKHNDLLVDESLVIGPNKGIKNVIVWLVSKDKVNAHPDLVAAAKKPILLDNNKCRFEPHVSLVNVGQEIVVKNSDPVGHNSKIDLIAGVSVNPLIPAMGEVKLSFKENETLPMPVTCNIHPWMGGRILIRDNPYMAVSDADGKLTIKNLPVGKWTFQVWHERPANITAPKVGGAPAKWAKGRVEVEIKAGAATDLGGGKPITLTLEQLQPKG